MVNLQPLTQAVFEPGGQHRLFEEELGIGHPFPTQAIRRDAAPGHQVVNVRMKEELAGPGVKDAGKPQFDAQFGQGHVGQGAGAFPEQRCVKILGVLADELAQLLGHGEGGVAMGSHLNH